MGIFNIFKRNPKEEVQEQPVQEVEIPTEVRGECWWCHTDVTMEERYSRQQGKLFHKNCYKEAKTKAQQGGII